MFNKTVGIVLNSLKYGDNGKIVTLYTEHFGRMSFIMQGIHRKKTVNKASLFQPLYQLELEVDYKAGRELQRTREVRLYLPYKTIPFDIIKSTQAIFLSEILNKTLREEEKNSRLFGFLSHAFEILDLQSEGNANFHLIILIQLASYLGFEPENNQSDFYPFFDLKEGSFVTSLPSYHLSLSKDESLLLSQLIQSSFEESVKINMSSSQRKFLLEKMIIYYGTHLGVDLKIKSIEVLHDLFHS